MEHHRPASPGPVRQGQEDVASSAAPRCTLLLVFVADLGNVGHAQNEGAIQTDTTFILNCPRSGPA